MGSERRAIGLAVVLCGGAAWACSGPDLCSLGPDFTIPVPANVPSLPLGGAMPTGDGGVGLTLADGGAVPEQRTGNNVSPTVPLVEGERYALHSRCFEAVGKPFTAGPAAPLPTSTGTLTVKESGYGVRFVPGGAACASEALVANATFTITPSPELKPFLGVTSWILEIDGTTTWASAPPGRVKADGSVAPLSSFRRIDFVHSACQANGSIERGMPPGVHVARLRASIGGVSLEPAEATFHLDCGSGCGCGASDVGPFAVLALLVALRRQRRFGCWP